MGITVAVGVPEVIGVTDVAAIAIGLILAVTLEAADWGWMGTVWGLMAAGLEAIGRMFAVLGGSAGEELKHIKLNPITWINISKITRKNYYLLGQTIWYLSR